MCASMCGAILEIRPFGCLRSNSFYGGHCLVGSLTGVVASKSVTEASKADLGPIGTRPLRGRGHKGAGLGGRHPEQAGNWGIVIRRVRMEGPSLKG